MEKIKGNFLSQGNKDFPLDCETLDGLQRLVSFAELLGNIGGDKVILEGCKAEAGGKVSDGYVFVRTQAQPGGEVLRMCGGDVTMGVHVETRAVSVRAGGREYAQAYSVRELKPGVGSEMWGWEEFSKVPSVRELSVVLRELGATVEKIKPKSEPVGLVMLWGGKTAPAGWLVCDGRDYAAAEYAELHKVVGEMYNEGANANGGKWTSPGEGRFRVPDLRSRFVVGVNEEDEEYGEPGASGGSKEVTLTVEEMPRHQHEYTVRGATWAGARNGSGAGNGVEGTEKGWRSEWSGGGEAHENRPPYYAMVYIIKAK